MISVIILSFISAGLATIGAPHFIGGVGGQKHTTPFGRDGSAIENVVWGWLSLAVAVILWHFAPMATHPRAAFVGAAVGALVVGLGMAASRAKK